MVDTHASFALRALHTALEGRFECALRPPGGTLRYLAGTVSAEAAASETPRRQPCNTQKRDTLVSSRKGKAARQASIPHREPATDNICKMRLLELVVSGALLESADAGFTPSSRPCVDAPDEMIAKLADMSGVGVTTCAGAAEKGLCSVAASLCPKTCDRCQLAEHGRTLQSKGG
eukprot:5925125-Prymnesium_polylepis.1